MKKLILPLLLFIYSFSFAQPVPYFFIDTICDQPPTNVNIPVQIMNFTDINSFSFRIFYDHGNNNLVYQGYTANSVLNIGTLLVNNNQGQIMVGWFSVIPMISLPDYDTLFTFEFFHIADSCNLLFDTLNVNNSANGLLLPESVTIAQQPQDFTTGEGQVAVFNTVPASQGAVFQWQYSMDGGITWFDIPDNPPFYGVNTSVLIIDSVMMQYDQYQFRNRFLNCNANPSDPATLSVFPNASFSGTLHYQNIQQSPLVNAIVSLEQGGITLQTTTTNNNGEFIFPFVQAGNYDLKYQVPYPWGGVNASDALMIMQHTVGLIQLTGLNLQVADLNNSGNINSIDALLALKRFVGQISQFLVEDWQYNINSVTVQPNATTTADIKGLCAGDVNGSYIP